MTRSLLQVETPDRIGREAILKVHVSTKELPLGDDVDLGDIASMTTGFTGYLILFLSDIVLGILFYPFADAFCWYTLQGRPC